jgi:membrane-associated protein
MLEILGHLDQSLLTLIKDYGVWSYFILAAIIFGETGLVVLPMLPGDSLLFVIGAAAASGAIDFWSVIVVLSVAATMGNLSNFTIGRWVAPYLFKNERSRWLNPEYLAKTHAFYEKHGGKTVILARFVPIIRTYAPFAAGLGTMEVHRFQIYSAIGAVSWVGSMVGAGYLFGDIPLIKGNLSLISLGIIIVTLIPAMIGAFRSAQSPKR